MRKSMIVFSVALAACSSTETIREDSPPGDGRTNEAPGAGDVVAGSRLRPRWFVADDGARSFNGWFDAERGEPCYFQRTSDGRQRCLPQSAAYVDATFFSDAACKKSLVTSTKSCSTPSVALRSGVYCGPNEAEGMRLYEVGAAFAGTSIYSVSSGECKATSAAPYLESRDFYFVGDEISPDAFVGGQEETRGPQRRIEHPP